MTSVLYTNQNREEMDMLVPLFAERYEQNNETGQNGLTEVGQFWSIVSSQNERFQSHILCLNDGK